MSLLDWVLIGLVVVFALAGWHRGFVAGLFSFVGFIGGGLLAAFILPPLVQQFVAVESIRVAAAGVGILLTAILGQMLASIIGSRLRGTLTWRPVRLIDNVAGAGLNVLALAIVLWIMASALVYVPVPAVAGQVSDSKVLVSLDELVPPQARNAFGDLRNLVGATEVPRIFSGLAQINGPEVEKPTPKAVTAAVDDARDSVVQVRGRTPECGANVSGSGFVIAPGYVVTNAHVVAGAKRINVKVRQSDSAASGTVVYFDPAVDIALLHVPDLSAVPLDLAQTVAETGAPVVVAGFPNSGPYQAVPARVRTQVRALGDDIYGDAGVERQVYVLRGEVMPGNSGGPLLLPDGTVAGMVFGADEQSPEVGYAITADEVRPVMAELGATDGVGTGSCRIRD